MRFRIPQRRTIFRTLSWGSAVVAVLVLVLGIWIYRSAVGRFQLRKLRLPTRIYADYTPLTAGVPLQADDLLEKLDRLGYREAERLQQPGDYLRDGNDVDIYTRAFEHPTGSYPAESIRVTLGKSQIESVVSLREARPLDRAALEPELLTSVLSEQLENRSPVTLDQVPQHLQDAVVVTEDVRFWHHPGVDPFGIVRAVFRNLKAGGVQEGASTLTQQLVKNYYLTSERTFKRKIVEAVMAVILDARYSKKEILEAYLNDIYLGRNRSISILGVGQASRFYFGKPVSEIDIAEAALLAGMIRSPNNNSPFNSPETAMKRRNTVLRLLLKEKKITQEQYEKARSADLPRKPFRERSGLSSIPYYVDRVLDELEAEYGIDDVRGRGLRIYTAIDLGAQDAAARSVEQALANLEKRSRRLRNHDPGLQGALIHVDVPTGEIRALVGGRNYEKSQFNRALKSKRLVGSLFKPFVYLTAFEPSLSNQNITPATLVADSRFVLKRRWSEDWSPRNYDGRYQGNVTVRHALEQSLNAASVRIGLACGIPPIIKTAHTLGVRTEMDDDNPAILLGAIGIPPIEMAEAYSTIARQGARMPLRAIRFVTDDRGRALPGGGEVKPVQVFPQRDVFLLTNVMKGVVSRGTAGGARSYGFRKIAAGKTGTTNDKRDAWFIGFTPHTLAVTWVGFDDNDPTGLSGSDAAVPMWARYMTAVTANAPNDDFAVPGGISWASIDRTSGGLAGPYCPPEVVMREAFKTGTEPSAQCTLHLPPASNTLVPMYDENGNLILTDTALAPPPADSTTPPVAPEGTLTGGVFREPTATAPPPSTTAPPATGTLPPTSTAPPPGGTRPPSTNVPPAGSTRQPPPTSTAAPPTTTAPTDARGDEGTSDTPDETRR
jgi:penicillin-binding protein 1B